MTGGIARTSIELPAAPREAHASLLSHRRDELSRWQRLDRDISIARGVLGVVGIAAWAAAGLWALAATALVFLAVVIVHERVVAVRDRAARRVAFHEAALERLDDDWAGRGQTGERYLDPAHPYAADLDLFGRGSIFERLCSARTRTGEDVLASWLLAPAPPAVVRARQQAVEELRPRIDLREDLAVLGAEVRQAADSAALRAWIRSSPPVLPASLRSACALVSLIALALVGHWLFGDGRVEPAAFGVAVVALLARSARRWTAPLLAGVARASRDLETLRELLARLEAERFVSPELARLREAFGGGGSLLSRRVARLARLVELLDSQRNIFFAPLAFLSLWKVQLAAAVQAWRRDSGAVVDAALDALGEMEALCAIGAYAFENPADAVPMLVEDGPLFEGRELGHPLIPNARSVRSDLSLGAERRLLVVSGSNMSGKSTFLRTVGLNAVLAQAGAPVRARELRLSPLAVGASIRIQDSLQEGRSRFYAEITRVRQIMDLAPRRPGLLFLLDEIFHGTNSADRRVGAQAVLGALVRQGAMGLVTSHDLALAQIADDLAPLADNVHFEDHLEGDRIAFDYRLKPGPVRKSNALGLMRAVGLEV